MEENTEIKWGSAVPSCSIPSSSTTTSMTLFFLFSIEIQCQYIMQLHSIDSPMNHMRTYLWPKHGPSPSVSMHQNYSKDVDGTATPWVQTTAYSLESRPPSTTRQWWRSAVLMSATVPGPHALWAAHYNRALVEMQSGLMQPRPWALTATWALSGWAGSVPWAWGLQERFN